MSPPDLRTSFLQLVSCLSTIRRLEEQLEAAEMQIDTIEFYDVNPPSDDEEGEYDAERWEGERAELRAQLDGKWKVERSARMRDVVQ